MKLIFSVMFISLIGASMVIFGSCAESPSLQSQDSPTAIINVSGMICGGCSKRIEGTLLKLAGVNTVKADHIHKNIRINFDESKVSLDKIKQEIIKMGFGII